VGEGVEEGVWVAAGVSVPVEVGVAVVVFMTAGRGVAVIVANNVGVGGAAWAVNVAATRVATRASSVDVAACVGARDGSVVFVGTDDCLQLVNKIVISRKKQNRDFIDTLHY
jgi:hypothetical protein